MLAAEGDVEDDEQYVQRLEDEQMAAENEAVLAAEDIEDDGQYVQRLEDEQIAAENETFCPRDYKS
jgi:hypothetical protein